MRYCGGMHQKPWNCSAEMRYGASRKWSGPTAASQQSRWGVKIVVRPFRMCWVKTVGVVRGMVGRVSESVEVPVSLCAVDMAQPLVD